MSGLGKETASRLRDRGWHSVITGATGWLGRASIAMLSEVFGDEFGRRVSCFGSRRQSLTLPDGRVVPVAPLSQLPDFKVASPVIVLHFAFLTKDRVAEQTEQDYVAQNRHIRELVVELLRRVPVRGLLVASSGAIYDFQKKTGRDPSAMLYGQLKDEDERQFTELCAQLRIPLIIPRIFNISGAYVNKYRAYVLASIIDDIFHANAIRLNADQSVWRSFVSISDLLEICLRWLLEQEGAARLVFDAAGREVIEIGDLARRAGSLLGKPDLPIVRPALRPGHENRYLGNGATLQELAAQYHHPLATLDQQILMTAEYIKSNPPS